MLCRALLGSSGQFQGQAVFHPAVALISGKQKAVLHRTISRYLDVADMSQTTLLAARLLADHQGLGSWPDQACRGGGACVWLVGRAPPKFSSPLTQAPGQGPRLFMRHRHVFSCAFPHVPVHWPRPCAAKVTLPDSSKVHPPNVLLPTQSPSPVSPATRIGERRSTGAKVSKEASRGTRSASPLSAASKPALHPAPAFSLRTTTIPDLPACKRQHHQLSKQHRLECPAFPVRLLGTRAFAANSHARFPLSSLTIACAFLIK